MDITSFYLTNETWISMLYYLFISALAYLISMRVDKLYQFSGHQGIKIFRHAFIFFSLTFFIKALILSSVWWSISLISNGILAWMIMDILYLLLAYFFTLSSAYLVYSLLWRRFKLSWIIVSLIHLIAFLVGLLYILFPGISDHVFFLPQIVILSVGSLVAFRKYKSMRKRKVNGFLQLYFIAFIMMIIGIILNYLGYMSSSPLAGLYSRGMTLIIFLIFIYGVLKITRRF